MLDGCWSSSEYICSGLMSDELLLAVKQVMSIIVALCTSAHK